MSRRFFELAGAAACSLLLAIPLAAADNPSAKSTTPAKTTTVTAVRSAWPPETLTGKIVMVDPAQKLLVIQGDGGVTFDIVVRPTTKIESGSQRLGLNQLSTDIDKDVSVRFVPERAGDVARTIQLKG